MLPLLGSLASAILFLVLFGWLAEEVFEGELQQFDLYTRNFVHQFATPPLTRIMQGFTELGSVGGLSILFGIAFACFLLAKLRGPSVWLLVGMGGTMILNVTLKLAFHRARPEPYFGPMPSSYSFPSGHAMGSFVFYGLIAGILCARISSQLGRLMIWSAATILVTAIGLSRIYLGVHYPTDVIAGYAAGAVWVSTLLFLDRVELRHQPRNDGESEVAQKLSN
jgi:undecaprenyl-diphosphatase